MPISLQTLALRGQFAPNVFPATVSHLDNPSCTMVSFHGGKTVALGTKNPSDALYQIYSALMFLYLDTGYAALPYDFRVENIVGSACLDVGIDVHRLSRELCMQAQHEQSIFPGAHMHLPNREEKFIVFKGGRMVITGAKQPHQIGEAFEAVAATLLPYAIVGGAADTGEGQEKENIDELLASASAQRGISLGQSRSRKRRNAPESIEENGERNGELEDGGGNEVRPRKRRRVKKCAESRSG